MGITNGNGIGMGMKTRLNLPGSGNRNGNEPFGMGGNGIKKVIPAHLYCVVYPVTDRARITHLLIIHRYSILKPLLLFNHWIISLASNTRTPTQPAALHGTGNEYRPKCGDVLRQGSKDRMVRSFHMCDPSLTHANVSALEMSIACPVYLLLLHYYLLLLLQL